MEESQRLLASGMFKAGQFNVLICTDIAIRDLDIPSVDIIISYDIPSNPQYYVYRIGRTACDGRSGVAISLVNQYELEWYTKIEKLIGKELPEFPAQEEEVLQFLEPVKEAKILAESKTSGSGDKKERMVKRILKSSLC
ncbi:DEAD-box ATP-dependent RNA helicase 10 [Rosa chinensis]|uniref:DEAD-box ATP-dependent RNA helicase 10 n=1 Tax=Rosa chinensis TaxID=74649 RepID=UPI001AD8D3E7|nr:DEAD-box ATP-dependent RNA helicase 10 [Rosa chinensis]